MDVHVVERLASGARYLAPLLLAQLDAYEDDTSADAPVLDALGMQVPIAVELGERVGRPPDGARVRLSARHYAERFPVFEGTIRIVPIDPLNSQLVLAGVYHVPLGLLGFLADRTVLISTAERSLRRLVARMKADLSAAALRGIMGN